MGGRRKVTEGASVPETAPVVAAVCAGHLGTHHRTLLREVALPGAPAILQIREHPRHLVLLVMGPPSKQSPCTVDTLGSDGETRLQRQVPCALGASGASWVIS